MQRSCLVSLVALVALGGAVHCGSDDEPQPGPSGAAGGLDGGTGGGTAQGGEGGGGQVPGCAQRCQRTAPLACPADATCELECNAVIDAAPWCVELASNFVACTAQEPMESWQCDEVGRSALVSGACQSEGAETVGCLTLGPPEGMPDLSAECAASCAAMQGLPCFPADCEGTCNTAIAEGPCAGAAGLITLCGSKLGPNDFTCQDDMPLPSNGQCTAELQLYLGCMNTR